MQRTGGKASLVIACGGTGGHLFPGLAVAEEWSARGGRVLLLVSEKKIDQEARRKYTQYQFDTVPAMGKPATFSPKMLPFLWRLWRTMGRCRTILQDFGADAVLGMGGFTSLPPAWAAKNAGLPAFIHDSNALPGKANRLTARFCRKAFIGWEAARKFFGNREVVQTGTPVRAEMRQLPDRATAAAKFGLDPARPTLMVTGGSQGARRLNSLVAQAFPQFPAGTQVLHIAGPGDQQRVEEEAGQKEGYKVVGFCDDMPSAYAVADAVLSRSGASSMTELSFLGLPSILVPFPFAADDHQTRNAEVFSNAGAAFLEPESALDATKLAARVSALMSDLQTRERMAQAARSLAVPDAAARVCDAIEATLSRK
ncbi:undecaprenyldiphospho-muramoylpentapeptide beta-N-acetylglucosaminyltransferase [Haloferula sp. BvORR071]|uniref:undecaprenyldiphospho-muramoylpentapeptide beta-N-acetylglucosaminyltransferase n=1 Tax=Haloferula sp. BvORR071 TaxID=1396141 RepID=UPI002240FD64|nr:undecaprenyldiphospho-muramoylpentapeptide beta-N-acetylglucosaminyltransferase [Haloferula sp. BvORR071]